VLHFENERLTLPKMIDMENNAKNPEKPQHDAKLPVSSFVALAKRNYKSKDGTIKEGVLIDGKWYAPRNDC
jgi:hypothetical protein